MKKSLILLGASAGCLSGLLANSNSDAPNTVEKQNTQMKHGKDGEDGQNGGNGGNGGNGVANWWRGGNGGNGGNAEDLSAKEAIK